MKSLVLLIWVFVTITSAIGSCVFAELLLMSGGSPNGPGAPLEGVAVLIELSILAVCVLVFLACLKFRPPKDAFKPLNLFISITAYGALAAVAYNLPRVTGGYTLTVHVLDSARKPIPGAEIRYNSFQLGSGLARLASPAKGSTSTDAQGKTTILTNQQHRTDGHIKKAGYRYSTFIVEPKYFEKHQFSISWGSHGRPVGVGEQTITGDLLAGKQVVLQVYLPANEEGDDLPYTQGKR